MKQDLNFTWQYTTDFKENYISRAPKTAGFVDIPHNMVDMSFNSFSDIRHQIIGTYFKYFDVDHYDKESSFILRFEGIMVSAVIYVNGRLVGEFIGGYLPIEVDITELIKNRENLLVVKVDGRELKTIPPWGGVVDFLSFSGIYREVSLIKRHSLDIIDAKVDGKLNGDVRVRPVFCNDKNEEFDATYQVYDSDNKLLATANLPRFNVKNIKKWDLRTPTLYTLVITLNANKTKISKSFNLAFRSIQFKEKGFYLNNVKVDLVGTNRHETYPYIGAAASKSLQADDVKILKNLGFTYVRCSHYPPNPTFLDACDKYGLLVVNEAPGWQFIGDEKWQDHHVSNVEKMINRDYNHPSIIAWSVRINESIDDEKLYTRTQNIAKKLDPYRPTTGTRNIKNSQLLEDIYSYNDFCTTSNHGLLAKKKIIKTKKPYIVSEAIGHTFPTKVYDEPIKQKQFIKRHLNILNDFYKHKNIVGLSSWCMHDYYTHREFGAGDHICYHGILDSFRNPKHSAFVYKSNLSKEAILHPTFTMDNGDIPGGHILPFYVLSNVHHIDLLKDGKLIKSFRPFKKGFKHLPSPPYYINYFIPKSWSDDYPSIKGLNKYILGQILNFAAINGLEKLSFIKKLYIGAAMKIAKITYNDLVKIWTKNVTSWGNPSSSYTLVGYNKDNHKIEQHLIGSATHYLYKVVVDKRELVNGATYDSGKIVINALNSNNMRNPYDFSVVNVKINGNIRISGPLHQNLHGGALTIYVHSLQGRGSGSIELTINEHRFSFDYLIK